MSAEAGQPGDATASWPEEAPAVVSPRGANFNHWALGGAGINPESGNT